jgi:hypothetical protein
MRFIAEKDGNGSIMARFQDRSRCARKALSYGSSVENVRAVLGSTKGYSETTIIW